MNGLLRWFQLLLLESRAYVLMAEIDNAEGLLADHHRRLANCRHELEKLQRQISITKTPAAILREAVR